MGGLIFLIWFVVFILIMISRAKAATKNTNTQQRQQNQPNQFTEVVQPPKTKVPDIVAKAQQNVKAYQADTTLEQMEVEHHHSEHVASATAKYVAKERQVHKEYHENPHPAIENESILGSIEDLMVKGYDGNLSFERDFVGEGLDMINRFVV